MYSVESIYEINTITKYFVSSPICWTGLAVMLVSVFPAGEAVPSVQCCQA